MIIGPEIFLIFLKVSSRFFLELHLNTLKLTAFAIASIDILFVEVGWPPVDSWLELSKIT